MGSVVKPTLLLLLYIPHICGYDRTLNFDTGDCNEYHFHDITQYESWLVNWNGSPFRHWCIVAFHGKNSANVATTYRVCFEVLQSYFGCDVKVTFMDGLLREYRIREFSCSSTVPKKWCTKYDSYARLKIEADKSTNSKLQMVVTVTADVSLSIVAALGITFGSLAVIIIAGSIIVWQCNKSHKKITDGRVVRSPDDLHNTPFEGQQLIGCATQQTEMIQTSRGRYRAQPVMVQHTIMTPSNTQPLVSQSAQNPSNPQIETDTIPSSETGTNSQIQDQPYISPAASAPPPSYDSYMQKAYGLD